MKAAELNRPAKKKQQGPPVYDKLKMPPTAWCSSCVQLTCVMVSQWSKTHWGKACPEVAALNVEVNPKDSMTGRYAFRLKIGVPAGKAKGSARPLCHCC